MGYKRPDRRPLHHHLSTPSSIGQMRRDGWVVIARCRACDLDLRIDLSLMIRLNGGDLVLFGKSCRCRRLNCEGRMVFLATPPGEQLGVFYPLRRIEGL